MMHILPRALDYCVDHNFKYISRIHTIFPKNYAYGSQFLVYYCRKVGIFVDFTEILHNYFIGAESVIRLCQCDREEYGKYFTRVMTWLKQIEIKRYFIACVVFSSMLFMQAENYFQNNLRTGYSSYMGAERFQLSFLNISAFLKFCFQFFCMKYVCCSVQRV